jgi:hypothetical protein
VRRRSSYRTAGHDAAQWLRGQAISASKMGDHVQPPPARRRCSGARPSASSARKDDSASMAKAFAPAGRATHCRAVQWLGMMRPDLALCKWYPAPDLSLQVRRARGVRLSVVVPFRNELRALPTVIQRLLAIDLAALGMETELIFVDDGSTDAGRYLIDPPPRDDIQLIVHERNQGKGAAVRTGLEAATGDILCILDADLEYDPADLPALIQPILDGEFEVVYGSRFKGSAAGLSYTHRVANRLLNVTVNVLFNRYLSDVYTGYKVFTAKRSKASR